MAIDLNAGGAITYLSEADSNVNMINNFDLGRQLQTALYGGPYPYSVNGKNPVSQWMNLGWNPVQTGDYYNHPSQIVSYQQTQTTLYVKTIPKIWPLFDEPADCVFEHWYEIKDNTIHVRCRAVIGRSDTTQYAARTQEAPCVYLNGPYYRIVTYAGLQPFSNGGVTEWQADWNWLKRYCTERWIALLNAKGRGVGLVSNDMNFVTDAFGPLKVGGETDGSSTYISSQPNWIIDYNGVIEYEYTLVLGSVNDIRQFAYSQPRPSSTPNFTFTNNRLGWTYYNTRDKGYPINNELAVRWERADTANSYFRVISPISFWQASDVPRLYIQAAFTTKATTARLLWRKPDEADIIEMPSRYVDFPIIGDGQYRTYEISMNQQNGWDGPIMQLGLTSPPSQRSVEKGSIARIRSITGTR